MPDAPALFQWMVWPSDAVAAGIGDGGRCDGHGCDTGGKDGREDGTAAAIKTGHGWASHSNDDGGKHAGTDLNAACGDPWAAVQIGAGISGPGWDMVTPATSRASG